MQRFLRKYPDLVESRTVRKAWAHTYAGYGDCLHQMRSGAGAVLRQHLRALRYEPSYALAWKGIARALLGFR
jgi:hypothetical protein